LSVVSSDCRVRKSNPNPFPVVWNSVAGCSEHS
jgi:hypothetical protein